MPFFRCSKILGEACRQARNFITNVQKILDLKLSSEQIFSKNWRWVTLLFKENICSFLAKRKELRKLCSVNRLCFKCTQIWTRCLANGIRPSCEFRSLSDRGDAYENVT